MSLRLVSILLSAIFGCASEPEEASQCAERLSFYDRPELYRVAAFPDHPSYYAAFLLDPDGNNIEIVHHGAAERSAESIVIRF